MSSHEITHVIFDLDGLLLGEHLELPILFLLSESGRFSIMIVVALSY